MTFRDIAGSTLAQTGLGLLIGTSARYAMRIQDRMAIGWREIVADVLLLGLNGFLTFMVVERLGATGNGAIITAAMFGIAQDRVTRAFLRWSERRADQIERLLSDGGPPAPAASPAPPPRRSDIENSVIGKGLRRVHRAPTREAVPRDQTRLIDKLDEEP